MKFMRPKYFRKSYKIFILVLIAILILPFFPEPKPVFADGGGWLSGYSYRKQITISNTNVGADLLYFPVLVASTSDSEIGAGVSDTTNGHDIRFTSSNGSTLLTYERESFSVTSGSASFNFWVRVPTVATAAPTVIYIYYGKASDAGTDWTGQTSTMTDCTAITNAQCVWKEGSSQNFATVYHLKETGSGSSSDYKDATANANNGGQSSNEPTHTDSGRVNGAQSFNGSTNYISLPNASSIKPALPITISAFIKSANVGAFGGILMNDNYNQNTSGAYYGVEMDQSNAGKLRVAYGDGLGAASSNRRNKFGVTAMSANTWYHVASVIQGSTNMNLYLNGVDDGGTYSGTGGTLAYSSAQGRIGEMDSNLRFNGIIDELRISNVVRTAPWLKFEYCNMFASVSGTCAGGNELTYAAQETPPAGFVVSEITPVSTPTNNTAPSYTFNSTEAGTITYGGDCSSATTAATAGDNTITFNTLSAGTHSNCTIYVTDVSSNQSNTLSVTAFTIDLTAPTISSITTTLASGTYSAGQAIPITVNFSKIVTSSGNVTVTLNTTPSRNCTFTVSNSTSGSCTYTTQSGDTATHLDATISGTITDQAGNVMSNFVPAANLSASKTINIGSLTPPADLTGPVPVIIDTAMSTDVGSPPVFPVVGALAQQGKAKLLASICDTSDPYCAPLAAIMDAWWGYSTSTVPVGAYQGSAFPGISSRYTQQAVNLFGISGDTRANYPSALTVYRQALADAADNSVVIIYAGYLQNLKDLLQSPADGISSLTGLQLVTQKVRRLVVMGGEYPSGSEHNFNLNSTAASSAAYVMDNWPSEIVVDGYTFGATVFTRPSASRNTTTDPLAEIWSLNPGGYLNAQGERESWDLLNAQYAIEGLSTNYTAAGISGINTVNPTTGANSWASPGLGNVTYLGKAISDASFESMLNTIIDTTPIIISSISSGTPAQTGTTISWTTRSTATVTNGDWVPEDIQTDSEVDYGTTSAYGSTATDATAVSSHSVALSGLSPNTTYHYRVKSTYSDGSYAVSDDQTFTTSIATHTITPSAGSNGSISPSGATSVNDGGSQSFTITPVAHYHVADVLVDSVSVGAVSSYDFTNVTVDHTISATFAIDTKTLTYTAGANGSITGDSPQTIDYGSDGTAVTAVPSTGYYFVDWSDSSTDNPRTDTNVTDDISVTANFVADSVPVTSSGGGGCYGCYVNPIVPTSGFKLSINGGVATTSNRNVFLGFNAGADIKKMAISMTGDFTDASQENYIATKQWDLCSKLGGAIKNPICPDGKYTVYAKFYTAYGRSSDTAVASSTIVLKSGAVTENLQRNLPFSNPFTKYLQYRQTNPDIKRLQIFLNSDPDTKIADTGAGSPGKETNYFGLLTYKAVIKFQEKYAKDVLVPWGLVKGTGYVGKTTLSKINELIGNK